MELYNQILLNALNESEIIAIGMEKIIESKCYLTLKRIVDIVKSPDYEDKECFLRIERILLELEKIGIDIGFRHDFG